MSKQAPGSGSLKDLEQKRRDVFKPILDNPYTQGTEWPQVSSEISKSIVDYLTQYLASYGRINELRKAKKSHETPKHELDDKITIGFNSTVKRLEEQAAPNREKMFKKLSNKREDTTTKKPYVKYVFVAKADITTPLLTSCFPLLTFSASRSLEDRVKLIELPRGSMEKLLKTLQTERVTILSLSSEWLEAAPLFNLIDSSIQDVSVPWLEPLLSGEGALDPVYVKPDIRFLKTSAPIGRSKKGQKRNQKQNGASNKKQKPEEKSKEKTSKNSESK